MIWGPLIMLMLSQQPADQRCTLRVSANGVFVDGDRTTAARAVATCKHMSAAIVVLENAPAAAWEDVRKRLAAAKLKVLMRGTLDDRSPREGNPLAKGTP